MSLSQEILNSAKHASLRSFTNLSATEILLDPADQSPANQEDISAEIDLVHSAGGSVFRDPRSGTLFAIALTRPVYPKHAGPVRELPVIPYYWSPVGK